MNLSETVQALEAKDIQVAIDLGVHQRCLLDSNCPKAVELRTEISKAGIELTEILEGYQAVTAPDPFSWDNIDFGIDGRVTLEIAGQRIQLDLTQEIEAQLADTIKGRIEDIRRQEQRLKDLGNSLYERYLYEIARLRETRALPQLSFTTEDLLRYNIMVSSEGDNYIFLSPALYRPEYIIRDGIRYELSTEDKKTLRREVVLQFTITKDNRFLSMTLFTLTGQKFEHYHGRTGDCWGTIPLPRQWDRSLRSLDILKIQTFNALVTINYNSLMQREPPAMPHIDQLLARSTKLGREGVLGETTEQTGTRIGGTGTRWGAR